MEHVDLTHPYFGRLRYDEGLDGWETAAPASEPPVEIFFAPDACEDEEALLSEAEAVCRDLLSWRERALDRVVMDLLPLKNGPWRDRAAGEAELTAQQMRDQVELGSITFYGKGEMELLHDDGDLFSGHAILVSASIDEGPTEASLAG